MIRFEYAEVMGWGHAIRGMRNPLNSWNKSDSYSELDGQYIVGENDLKLMNNLTKAGTDHRKFARMVDVYVDITAPLYWWKEFDTYKVGTVANSTSTMHKIHSRDLTLDDFSHEHLRQDAVNLLKETITAINYYRSLFIETNDSQMWWQMIQLLPTSYNQMRTVKLNYEVLMNIYHSRKHHKLDEWQNFCKWIEGLPYFKEITGNEEESC